MLVASSLGWFGPGFVPPPTPQMFTAYPLAPPGEALPPGVAPPLPGEPPGEFVFVPPTVRQEELPRRRVWPWLAAGGAVVFVTLVAVALRK